VDDVTNGVPSRGWKGTPQAVTRAIVITKVKIARPIFYPPGLLRAVPAHCARSCCRYGCTQDQDNSDLGVWHLVGPVLVTH
jgi:hypothetical protein